MTERIRLGLFGLGVVGSGFYRILESKRAELRQRFGVTVEIAGICVRDESKDRDSDLPRNLLTSSIDAILKDESIDIVLELMGGYHEALRVIDSALEARKHVISANKLLLANELPRLVSRAERQGVNLFYSASVCGSVPVLKALDDLKVGDTILGLRGIVNGSTNFILTQMTEGELEYGDASQLARERGFLEADPTLDVSGLDAAQKLSILSYHAFGEHLPVSKIRVNGIEAITREDIRQAEEEGCVLKLLAEATVTDRGIDASVSPQWIDRKHIFSQTRDEFNALEIATEHAGPQLLYGKGAGSYPTASAVLSDLIQVLREQEVLFG